MFSPHQSRSRAGESVEAEAEAGAETVETVRGGEAARQRGNTFPPIYNERAFHRHGAD